MIQYQNLSMSVAKPGKLAFLSSLVHMDVYMDDLSPQLNVCNTGCIVGNVLINQIIYAGDLLILCPYCAGLHQLLMFCF